MFFFLALRNIFRNKKNSAIIALLIAVITFLFFIGNSVMGRVDRIIRQAYTESLTGDVVLEKSGDVTMNLFGANTPVIDEYFTVPVFPAHDAVMELLSAETEIAGITSQVSGKAFVFIENIWEAALLCGIDADSYFSLFPGIILEEGRLLRAGEYGAMITAERARRIEQQTGRRPSIGMPLLLTSGGKVGFKIREVPLVGIFRYPNPGQFMNEIVIIDPQTVRVLNLIQVASGDTEAGENSTNLLNTDLDDLFGEGGAGGELAGGVTARDDERGEPSEAGFSVDFLERFLGESATGGAAAESGGDYSGGDWNFIMLRLKKGASPGAFIASLNKKLASYGITAVNWRTAAGNSAILALLVQILFNAGMFLVSVAGVITVINIFLISVFRRTREIGTLRAIGASDIYIRSLVLSENLIIALAAGAAGLAGGVLFMRWINGLGFHIPNGLIASILGGPVLNVGFLPHVAVVSLVVAVALGLLASVYPVEAAVRIEPIVAVRQG